MGIALSATPLYRDRLEAGRAIARELAGLVGREDVVVLGMPRGGVAVASAVAEALRAPLDVIVARKLGVPGLREVAMGAIAEGTRSIIEDSVRWYIGIPRQIVSRVAARERVELERRVKLYRGVGLRDLRRRTVVLVDDGLASGTTLRAAAAALRRSHPARIIAAVPVASPDHCDDVRKVVDELVALATPSPFETVANWYEDFSPVTDVDVMRLLKRSSGEAPRLARSDDPDASDETETEIPITGRDSIVADLGIPNESPNGLVILAHGGGSSRNSYRNRYLAGRLRMEGWATLRVDLLTPAEQAEDADGDVRFDIARISQRLQCATEWASRTSLPGAHRIILLGASTGAAAALVTAAARPDLGAGVASRGGRVDLAGPALRQVQASVLMVVGGADVETLQRNGDSAGLINASKRIVVVPGAGHTFEEPGTLGSAGEHIVRWMASLSRGRGWLSFRR
jgi:putative phosphoribosyl transferase